MESLGNVHQLVTNIFNLIWGPNYVQFTDYTMILLNLQTLNHCKYHQQVEFEQDNLLLNALYNVDHVKEIYMLNTNVYQH